MPVWLVVFITANNLPFIYINIYVYHISSSLLLSSLSLFFPFTFTSPSCCGVCPAASRDTAVVGLCDSKISRGIRAAAAVVTSVLQLGAVGGSGRGSGNSAGLVGLGNADLPSCGTQ